ncbi:MAG: hypothetical protein LAP21_03355 [Acidobacteriia bacterium]|nr:hypothetical protein [Terriglobia bacterium]
MKKSQATIIIFLTTAALLAVTGCKKHKPDLPPQTQAPTVTEPPPQPTPAPANSTGSAPADSGTSEPPARPPRPPVRAPRTTPPRKATPATDKSQEITKVSPRPAPRIVIQQGGTSDPSAGAPVTPLQSHDDAAHSQASTAQLTQSTEANVNAIQKRQLSADEQSVVTQIQDYVAQSKQATKDGDLVRARNLALKAHLLSDELAKPR